ncbi:HpcH/HpaI aldolase/citrate lyase family protein [Oleiharenicola sp. Vm1]|uniref:HpcH/HpaI aldolase/citrate lyase family protein n=1 Tax=Oleiharenicola sp. Vm1 TaxID=3398393 RepID=UPI0039F5F858
MRSKLFVPASRPELFPKALASAADSLSFDLEDAVAEEHKDAARQNLAAALASPEFAASAKIMIARVNAPDTPHFAADLAAVVHPRLDYVNLPKVDSAADIRAASAALAALEQARGLDRRIALLANIETPRALRCAAEIAAADPRVVGLQLAFADLLEPLGIDRTNAAVVQQLQLALRLAAGEANVWAYDAAYGAIKDADGFRAEAVGAKRLGFLGKSCVHPSQIAIANEVFQPSAAEIDFARRVVEAASTRAGAFALDGRMIDAPFIRRAHAVLAAAAGAATR